MTNIEKHMSILGLKAEDKVTGFTGVVSTISFDLFGCVQAVLTPGIDKDGKPKDGHWYDIRRLKILTKKPVMEVPNFNYGLQAEGKQGCSEKPLKG